MTAQAQKQSPALSPSALPSDDQATPLMAQYLSVKARHADCLVFFRLGDFYELFFDDAVRASRALDITLTRRGQMNGQDVPMCGVPAHSYENYLARLIRQGFKVAICEQTETPEEAKKRGGKSIVTRDVVRIVTPGTLTEDSLLEARAANYLSAVVQVGDGMAVAWLDLASGQPFSQTIAATDIAAVLARIDPREVLVAQRLIENPDFYDILAPWRDQLSPQPNSRFDSDNAQHRLKTIYEISDLSAFGSFARAEIAALGAVLDYAELTQKNDLKHLQKPQQVTQDQAMAIDPATRRNLELSRTMAGEKQGSLLHAIDRSMTGAGARLLAARLATPSTNVAVIQNRLDAVDYFVSKSEQQKILRSKLSQLPDLERSLSRLALGRGGPRDLAAVRNAAQICLAIRSDLASSNTDLPSELTEAVQYLAISTGLIDRLQRALGDDLPMLARDGNFIARGFSPQLDHLVALRDDGRRLIAGLQQNYVDVTGVNTLKIKHNNVIGY